MDSESQLAQLKRDCNRLIPVGRLPFETLSAILEIELSNITAYPLVFDLLKKKHIRLAQLSTVCAYWRDVIEGTPQFWRRIDGRCPLQLVRKIISKLQPLQIYHDIFAKDSSPYPLVHTFFEASEKWEDVHLHIPLTCALELESVGPVPMLTTLPLECSSEDLPTRAVNVFGGEAPQLRSLEIQGVALPWDCPLLKNLITLKLMRMGENAAPSIQELLFVISACPTLVHFGLEDWKRTADSQRELASIDAPHLSQIVISTSGSRVSNILRYVRAPACRRLGLESRFLGDDQSVEEIFHPNHHRHVLDHVQQHVEQDDEGGLNLSIGDRSVHCRLWTSNFELSSDLRNGVLEPLNVLHRLLTMLGRAPGNFSTTINLRGEVDITDEALFGLLNMFPNTKRLSYFPDLFQDADPLVDRLMTAAMFPHLESLELQFCGVILDDILKMVEMRCGRRPWSGQGHLQSTAFRELRLDHPQLVEEGATKNYVLRKIKDILGEQQATIWESDDDEDDGEDHDDESEDDQDPVESVAD